ncbi:hypothetical protein FQN53_004737 [Emmonsiellopsis sp. PD_33]|nr:hypothetical protein FQN53_004737 [Emmonsiellopsis sp. PD_33]
MRLGSQGGTVFFWIAVSLTASLVKAQQCVEGQYWCQDRCGTDADTCCDTPNGQHNLCGPGSYQYPESPKSTSGTDAHLGTICCGFGCCPNSSFTCNADFSCTGPDGVTIPPAGGPGPTTTAGGGGGGGGGGNPAPGPTGTVVIIGTQTATLPAVTVTTTVTTLDHTFTLTPPTNTDPAQPPPTIVIIGTETATLPPITQPTTIVTIGTTLTLSPPTPPETTSTGGPGQGPATPIVVIDGTKTLTFPPLSTPTTVTTDGETFTLVPNGPPTITVGKPPPPVTTSTDSPGQDPGKPVVVIDGTKTLTFPPVSTPTTVTTDGETFTLVPNGPPTITVGKPPPVTTSTDSPGQDPGKPVVVIDGTKTLTFPPVSTPTTVTTDGETFTLVPNGPPTITVGEPAPPTTTSAVVVVIGTESLTFPPVTQPTTVTTEGQTFTFVPEGPPTITVSPPPPQTTDDEDPSSTLTQWPPEAIITPVEQKVEKPEPEDDDDDGDDDSAVVPCDLWFFTICIKFPSINIQGWKFKLPPGIYPPGPPPIGQIKLPTGIRIKGELPPWPKFSVGPNHVPTFPKEPEPTNCQTKTAELCFETTSFIVSTVDGTTQTVGSTVPPPQCGEVRGCAVVDATQTATATKTDGCETATVTDVVITCSGDGATACSTKTEIPKTGCSVTPTTTTVSCTPAPTDGNARRQEGDNFCPVAVEYLVWPRDGTKTDETNAIYAEMQKLLQDESKIKVFDTKSLGVDFWRVRLEPGQVEKVEKIPNVAAVYQPCTDCGDPSTDWRYQVKYLDDDIGGFEGRSQMIYLSANEESEEDFDDRYFFDVSAGEDIPVYIVDTGAQLDHREFEYIAGKAEYMFVADDYDGKKHKDDGGTPIGGKCIQGQNCNPHGTSMLGFVAGKRVGIAKKVKPYIVRVPRRKQSGSGGTPDDYLRGVALVNDAFTGDSGTVRAILNLSWRYNLQLFKQGAPEATNQDFEVWKERLHVHITSLIRKGVFVVTGSGNGYPGYPGLFGSSKDDKNIPELLVVGAANPVTGKRGTTSFFEPSIGIPHIYGPGEDVIAPDGNKATWRRPIFPDRGTYKVSTGTSDATSYTSGLAAYFLKLHQLGRLPKDAKGNDPDMSPAGLKQYILNNGWSRVNQPGAGDIVGIWNGAAIPELKKDGYCPYNLKTGKKLMVRQERQEGENNDDIPATATCVRGGSPTGFVCTPETVSQCAPGVVCSAPLRSGCKDGKCVCLLPPAPTTHPTVTRPKPTTTNPTTFSTVTSAKPTTAPECDDKCKLDRGNPCNCGESGCDEQSPVCCGNNSCPTCECDESGCSDSSPACCANGTCEWSKTSSVGVLIEPSTSSVGILIEPSTSSAGILIEGTLGPDMHFIKARNTDPAKTPIW